ncbi:hypothetical protein [Halovivax cerinus]|uniref:DUF7837 domain-containing protein n=1 Tax=Halovivax cerinus TaxID=1487865 RepID=A0ABD5NKX0_9EURY|nr:hypothetical protein [Halovivax cerinus]
MIERDGAERTAERSIGDCPRCGSSLPRAAVLIEYEVGTCETAYAACPTCDDVVTPR